MITQGFLKMPAHGLMFHHFHGKGHPHGQGALSACEFDSILHHVGLDRIVDAKTWQERALVGALSNECCITFDDGLRCQYDVALPVLRKLGLTAFWFVYSLPLERQLDRMELYRYFRTVSFDTVESFYDEFELAIFSSRHAQCVRVGLESFAPETYLAQFEFYTPRDRWFRYVRDKILDESRYFDIMDNMIEAAGFNTEKLIDTLWLGSSEIKSLDETAHVIGLHSHTHPTNLTALSRAAQVTEYKTNRAALTALLGSPPIAMAHPCNSYDTGVLDLLAGLGVRIGFRSNMETTSGTELEYPREDSANLISELNSV